MARYKAEIVEEIDHGEGFWKTLRVGVFAVSQDGAKQEQVGEYKRNYSSLYRTFFHFQSDGKDFALYSPDYTVTRVMELPSCRDIGGEAHGGFCPTDYFVPTWIEREYLDMEDKVHRIRVNNPQQKDLLARAVKYFPLDEKTGRRREVQKPSYAIGLPQFYSFGFVAGCIWGDDSSWKIQYLDLSDAHKGVVRREEKFGYIELPKDANLENAIHMMDYQYAPGEEWAHRISITHQQKFDLRDGKVVDPFE